jgi:hypothetical protein
MHNALKNLALRYLPLVAALAFLSAALAQTNQTAIGDLRALEPFSLSGNVVAVMGNTFALEDETGVILIDAGPPWWQPLNLRLGEAVSVVGRPKNGGFEAFSVTREDGAVMDIRPSMGSPPWAGPPWGRQGPPAGAPSTPPSPPGRP